MEAQVSGATGGHKGLSGKAYTSILASVLVASLGDVSGVFGVGRLVV